MEIILGVIVAVLVVIVAILGVIVATLVRRDKQRSDDLEFVIEHSFSEALKRERKKFAKIYAEEIRVAEWIEDLSKKGDLDVAKLATATEQQAYALALKRAQEAADSAQSGLAAIQLEILKAQKQLPSKVYQQTSTPYKYHKEALHRLYAQEKDAAKRVKSAYKRVTLLTADHSTTDLEEVLDNIEAAPLTLPSMDLAEPSASSLMSSEPIQANAPTDSAEAKLFVSEPISAQFPEFTKAPISEMTPATTDPATTEEH